MTKKKATEDMFNELHNLVTKEFLARIKSGEATTQDLKAACDWLAKNDISGIALDGSPLDKLATILPTVDPNLVRSRLNGTRLESRI
jgi:TPR repeat protein